MKPLAPRLLLCLAALAPGCCVNLDPYGVAMYASDLRPPGASLVAWPADAQVTRFRYVLQGSDGEIEDDTEVGELDLALDEPAHANLPEHMVGVLVLMPEDAGKDRRAAARELIAHVEQARPGISSSLIVTDAHLADVEDAAALRAALELARDRHRSLRSQSLVEAFAAGGGLAPRWIVVPEDAAAQRFVAIGDFWTDLHADDGHGLEEATFGEDELIKHLRARMSEGAGLDSCWIALLIPRGSNQASCAALAERLAAIQPEQGVLIRGEIEDAYEPGTTRASLERAFKDGRGIDELIRGQFVMRYAVADVRPR